MQRPAVESVTSATDIEDWYWTRAELDVVARRLGVSRSGSKADLTARLTAVLSGQPVTATPRRRGAQLQAPFSIDAVVPPGQRMTRELREFMQAQVGEDFRFDAVMREFFADPQGRTLADAVGLWHTTRGQQHEIPEQFEFNRFTRAYRSSHPDATARQVHEAWFVYKNTPISRRGRV